MRILLVEDDESIVELLTAVLVGQNYVVDVATDGESGWELVEAFPYDLILLDIMLPRLDGISFCRRLRERNNPVLVMLLTVRDTTTDKLMGLDGGADDYVIKPFNSQELIARVRALLRRGSTVLSSVLEYGGLQLDPNTRNVAYNGASLQFSRKEYLLLELFLRSPHRVFSRRAIVEHLWSFDEEAPVEDTVKSHIKNIRKELRRVGAGDLLETLYGQGYRLNPSFLEKSNPAPAPANVPPDRLDATVAQIWERKKGACLERLTVLDKAVQALKTRSLDATLHQKAIENAHKLAGGLGTFGLDEGSHLARQIETLLESYLPQVESSAAQHRQSINKPLEQLVSDLRQVIQQQPNQRVETSAEVQAAPTLSAQPQPILLVIDRDPALSRELELEAASWNIQVIHIADLAQLRTQLQHTEPNLILLDLDFLKDPASRSPLMADLQDFAPSTPIVVLSREEDYGDRLMAVQINAKLFLSKTTPLPQILQSITQIWQELHWGTAKVLVVGQVKTTRQMRTSLSPSLQITELNDFTQIWETIRAVHPDLLLLEMQVPDVNGLQLCQAIRQDPYWNWLPVVVLIQAVIPGILHDIFAAGADDYVTATTPLESVVVQVTNRIRRSRLLRSASQVDALTDLSNRQQSIQGLNQLLRIAQRSQQPVCFAVLDLDHFKRVNDQYGHMQGDRVLRQFGQFLKQKFRAGDVVARWGGEEFVVGMYGITWGDGTERLAEILEEWRSTPLTSNQETVLTTSFSAGVSQYPQDGITVQMLYRAADTALYRAKVAGRDRIFSTRWQPSLEASTVDVALIYPEDEDNFAQTLMRALDTRGYHTCWFKQGKDAIKRFRARRSPFQASAILLSDNLTDLSWRDLVKRLGTKQRHQMRIILLLSQSDTVEKNQADLLFDYLLVPCPTSVVMQRLRQPCPGILLNLLGDVLAPWGGITVGVAPGFIPLIMG
ncbi:response regulator [Egbenema bharatensis]|uniref:response regulator n=1 Tax=Egbenema bharatensis TaxID=3463334 RepID=UPI003A8C5596